MLSGPPKEGEELPQQLVLPTYVANTCAPMHAYTRTYIHTYVYIYIYIDIYTYIYIHMYIHIGRYISMSMHVHVCIFIHMSVRSFGLVDSRVHIMPPIISRPGHPRQVATQSVAALWTWGSGIFAFQKAICS